MNLKICRVCKQEKSIAEFHKDASSKDKHMSICKCCANRQHREHYKKHKDKYALKHKEFRKTNPKESWVKSSLSSHRSKGHIVNVTKEQLLTLVGKTEYCIYCGKKLNFTSYDDVNLYDRPSIDRVNNEREMRIDNIQIICFSCNTTKGSRTHDEFVEFCENISLKFRK